MCVVSLCEIASWTETFQAHERKAVRKVVQTYGGIENVMKQVPEEEKSERFWIYSRMCAFNSLRSLCRLRTVQAAERVDDLGYTAKTRLLPVTTLCSARCTTTAAQCFAAAIAGTH